MLRQLFTRQTSDIFLRLKLSKNDNPKGICDNFNCCFNEKWLPLSNHFSLKMAGLLINALKETVLGVFCYYFPDPYLTNVIVPVADCFTFAISPPTTIVVSMLEVKFMVSFEPSILYFRPPGLVSCVVPPVLSKPLVK